MRKTQVLVPLLLLLFLVWLLMGPALAQSSVPLASLSIALWPEYDRPEVLVIFRGQVAENVPLPAQVSFLLPASVQTLHAVAYWDEAQESLLNIPKYDLVEGPDGRVLTFTTPSRQFQFEYYSRKALDIRGELRQLTFSFTSSSQVDRLSLELQQPTAAQAFTSDPPPTTTEVRNDGLVYALYEAGAVSAGDTYSLQASYQRSTDELSINALGVNIPVSSEQTPVEVGSGSLRDNLGLILIGVGVLLLIGAFVYWFWSQRAVVVPQAAGPRSSPPRPRRSGSSRRRRAPGSTPQAPTPATGKKLATYCHRCGTRFRKDAQFCHACGARRRAD